MPPEMPNPPQDNLESSSQVTEEVDQSPPPADPPPAAKKEKEEPQLELSFKEKLAKRAEAIAAKVGDPEKGAAGAKEAGKAGEPAKTLPPGDPKAAPATPAPSFTPNFKYKVRHQEFEVPKWMQASITDEASQKEALDLLTKAQGLEIVRNSFNQLEQVHKEAQTEVQAYQQISKDLRTCYQRGDFDGFFKRMNIPVEKVLQWVVDKVNYSELPPDQQQVIDARRAAEQRAWEMEQRSELTQQQYEQQVTHARELELSTVLEKPEVKTIAETFDARVGTPGSFKAEVIRRGQLAAITRNVDLSAEDAVKEVLSLLGPAPAAPVVPAPQAPGAAAPAAAPPAAAAPAPVIPAKQPPPVIPNVAGRTQSPLKQKPKSIEDLKALYKAMP